MSRQWMKCSRRFFDSRRGYKDIVKDVLSGEGLNLTQFIKDLAGRSLMGLSRPK